MREIKRLIIKEKSKNLQIEIEGGSDLSDYSDLITEAIEELIETLPPHYGFGTSGNLPIEQKKMIIHTLAKAIQRDYSYPEEFTDADIITEFLKY